MVTAKFSRETEWICEPESSAWLPPAPSPVSSASFTRTCAVRSTRGRRPGNWRRCSTLSVISFREMICPVIANYCRRSRRRETMFIDKAVITVEGGTGGSGCTSFRREWRTPMGGPDGGDGGRGGSVIVRGDSNLATLLDYTYRDNWVAEGGGHGMGSNKNGRSGADIVMPVPPGTILRDSVTGEIVAEILEDGQELVIAQGGRGGKGNAFFATPTHQSPREWQPGEEGVVRTLEMELKLIADIGLVGQPNAGKSTLLSVISAARPKIADYPFTTLQPNLGVVQLSDHRTFVVADIPGIIEGAHEGKGLGLQFLRHIERTRILAFLIPIDAMH